MAKQRNGPRGSYREKTTPRGPLPEQVVYMVNALEVIDNTKTRNGFVPAFHIADILGMPRGTLGGLLVFMSKLGILKSRKGAMGGYQRLRKATIQELCGIVTDRYRLNDPAAWGPSLAGFHGKLKALIRECLV